MRGLNGPRTVGRRRFLGLGAALGAGTALAGCSNFTPATTSGSSAPFVFTFWGTGAEKTAVSKVVNDFAASKQITGAPQSIPDNYDTKLNTLIAAGNYPSAGYLSDGMAMRLAVEGKVASVAGQPQFANLLPQALHYWDEENAVGSGAAEVMVLWFDQDATDAAGVTPPASAARAWDYDALVQAADALTADAEGRRPSEPGFDPTKVERYGLRAPSGLTSLVPLLKSNGVDLFTEDGSATNIAQPEAVTVIQDVVDLIFTHRVSPTPAQAGTFGGSAALALASKRVAMVIDGQWALLDLSQSELRYNAAVLPSYQQPLTMILGGALGIFNQGPHRDLAFEMLAELYDPEKVPLYSNGLWMPFDRRYYTDEAFTAKWLDPEVHPSNYRTAVMEPALADPVSYPSYRMKNFAIIAQTLENTLGGLFAKRPDDVAGALEALAAKVDPLLQGTYPDSKP